MPPILALLLACHRISDLPVLDGEQCESDRVEAVECVLDGDTVTLVPTGSGVGGVDTGADTGIAVDETTDDACGGESVRLLGVDAPEIAHETDAECFGEQALSFLASLVSGQDIRLEFDAPGNCEDAYGRTLAYVYLDPGTETEDDDTFVNEVIIREGYATFYEEFGDIRQAPVLEAAELDARSDDAGLWSECQ